MLTPRCFLAWALSLALAASLGLVGWRATVIPAAAGQVATGSSVTPTASSAPSVDATVSPTAAEARANVQAALTTTLTWLQGSAGADLAVAFADHVTRQTYV